jgi:hypothetical protein
LYVLGRFYIMMSSLWVAVLPGVNEEGASGGSMDLRGIASKFKYTKYNESDPLASGRSSFMCVSVRHSKCLVSLYLAKAML